MRLGPFHRFFSSAKASPTPPIASNPSSNAPKYPPRPFAKVPSHPVTQHVYILPTLNNKLVFHPRLPIPTNALERTLTVAGYASRRVRFNLWDEFAALWHTRLGSPPSSGKQTPNDALKKYIYEKGNALGTRKADAEYFFKGIPLRSNHIEFIYPSSIPLRQVKNQLNEYLLSRNESKRSLFLWTVVVFPPALFFAKFMLPIMNIGFVYLGFRIASAWRAVTIGGRVQGLVDFGRVTFTSSNEFQKRVGEVSRDVEVELEEQGAVWKWDGKGDLHDLVLERLEKEYGMYEWVRTYRRARMIHFVHGGSDVKKE
ncbi:UNVERIFIED_CONTAM: hypothetical protein HDU68_010632 [Siphonaria sp. JEL0065]|nr:hypothetical protein HDU68_010632 [Siphonaria sp. JEL0065]